MTPLQVGIDAINATLPMGADYSRELIAAKCRGLLAGYDFRWHNSPYVTLSVERMLESDLWNPDTQRRSRTFRVAGKLDVIAREVNRLILFDHKTTSDDIVDPASAYWRQLVVEAQPSHYMLLAWLNGEKFDGAVWDVVKKPAIRPSKLSKAEVQMVAMSKQYSGRPVSDEVIAELQREPRETLDMYEARLAHDCTVERPQWYFQRRPVPRLDAEIREWAGELWNHGQDILTARNADRHPKNAKACMMWGSPCKFLGICSGQDTPDSDHWQRKQQVHSELPLLNGDGREVLTNSRIGTFQLCRRKHFYEYELGIERQDEEEREALFFGNLWHAALEAWFLCFTEKGAIDDSINPGAPVSEIGTAADNRPQIAS